MDLPGPPLELSQSRNYKTIQQILYRMNRMCVQVKRYQLDILRIATQLKAGLGGTLKPRKHEQRLLRNMGVHKASYLQRRVRDESSPRWSWTCCRSRMTRRKMWGWTSLWGSLTNFFRTFVFQTKTIRSLANCSWVSLWKLLGASSQTPWAVPEPRPAPCKDHVCNLSGVKPTHNVPPCKCYIK